MMIMIFKNNYIFLFTIFFAKCLGETCLTFLHFENEEENDNLVLPERIWRFNKAIDEFEKLEYVKPNQSALCSVDFTNDLKGKILHIAVDELSPYLIFVENKTKVTGFFGEVWSTLQQALKFKTIFEPSDNYSILMNGNFDALLTTSLMKTPSTAYFAYSTVIGKNSYSLYSLSEGTFVSKWWYTRIFDTYVWILSTVFVFVLTIAMVVIHKLKNSWCKQTECCSEFGYPTFNMLCVLGATSGQGFQEMPRSWSLRMCALTALNMGLLLSCGFNSTLTSYLAFRAPYVGMSNLDDVWRMGTHSLCVRNKSLAYYELFKTVASYDNSDKVKEKWMKLLNRNCPNMENELEFRDSLCQAGFVYVEASDVFLKQYQHVQDKCQIVKIPGTYWNSKIAFLHYRGSKYRHTINNYLMRLRSSGILKYLEAKWSFQQDLQHGVFSNFQPVELGHVKLLIIGLMIMMIFSVIICGFENIWFNLRNNSETSTTFFPINETAKCKLSPELNDQVIKKSGTKLKRLKSRVFKRNNKQQRSL